MLLFCYQMRFQLYSIFRLHILILIYQLDIFRMKNFKHLNIHQFYLFYYTHHHKYYDLTYIHLYKNPNHQMLSTYTDIYNIFIFALFHYHIHFHLIHIHTCTIHVELKILFQSQIKYF